MPVNMVLRVFQQDPQHHVIHKMGGADRHLVSVYRLQTDGQWRYLRRHAAWVTIP
ncbi:MAG: hypothetical protein HC837_05275 [Chloroflexaceae bacterium]|nr:hypothetical protein [Chloroflexaceae bacterium]